MDLTAENEVIFADSSATLTVGTADPVPVIFTAPDRIIDQYDRKIIITDPVVLIKQTDFDALSIKINIDATIAGTVAYDGTYTIYDYTPDGTGLVTLFMSSSTLDGP